MQEQSTTRFKNESEKFPIRLTMLINRKTELIIDEISWKISAVT